MSSPLIPRRFVYKEGKISDIPQFICLGYQSEDGMNPVVTVHNGQRNAHMYVCGITGSGKSRFLESMMVQDVSLGHPLCVIDPTGHLFRQALEYIARSVEHAQDKLLLTDEQIDRTLERYLFLNADDPNNPLKINPLDPGSGETTEEMVDDLLKIAERLFGSVDEMRRIRQTLRNTLWVLAELNRLPEKGRPSLPLGYAYPLNLRFCAKFLSLTNDERTRLVEAIPNEPGNEYIREFWLSFFVKYTPAQAQERLESTWNILQYFLGDSLVSRFLDTGTSSFSIPDLMREKKSLFCYLPLGKNLKGCQLLGTFLATKFQRAAYRRTQTEREQPYYLYIDEFQEFADLEFAKAAATLRQYNLRMVNAHQSQSQPPFHTEEGKSILNTIKGNSLVKALFRLTREDAEVMCKETFELTQHQVNFREIERTITTAKGTTVTRTTSFQKSRNYSETWSRSRQEGIAKTESIAIGKTVGTNIGKTLTRTVGTTVGQSLANAISLSESQGITEAHSKQHGISVAIGENWSHMINHNTGFSFTEREGQSLAINRNTTRSQSSGEQTGTTENQGQSYVVGDSYGNNISSGQSIACHTTGSTGNTNTVLGQMSSHMQQQGQQYGTALQRMRSTTNGIAESSGTTKTKSHDHSHGHTISFGNQEGQGGSLTSTINGGNNDSVSFKQDFGKTTSRTATKSLSRTDQTAMAESFSQMEQVSRTLSEALQRSVSVTDSMGGSVGESYTEGGALAKAQSHTSSTAETEKKVYFTLEGERELMTNKLQTLPKRRCIITKEALGAIEIETLEVPERFYFYQRERLPEDILNRQQKRFAPHRDNTQGFPVGVDFTEPEQNESEQESWFPEW